MTPQGGNHNQSFWTDATRAFEWDWRFEWSGQKFRKDGYLGVQRLANLAAAQNYMYLWRNASGQYEYAADRASGPKMGYICEAQVPCQSEDAICKNNGTCYTNNGKVRKRWRNYSGFESEMYTRAF